MLSQTGAWQGAEVGDTLLHRDVVLCNHVAYLVALRVMRPGGCLEDSMTRFGTHLAIIACSGRF